MKRFLKTCSKNLKLFWLVRLHEIYNTSNYLVFFYIERNLLQKSGKGKIRRQISKLVGISFQNYKWAKKYALIKNAWNEWRGDTDYMYTNLLWEFQIWIRLQTERFGFLPRSAAEQFHEITTIQEREMKKILTLFCFSVKKGWIYIQFSLGLYFAPWNIPNGNIIINLIQVSITSRYSTPPPTHFFF